MNEADLIDVTPPEDGEGGVVEYELLPGGLPDIPDDILFKLLTRRALGVQTRARVKEIGSDFKWEIEFGGRCQDETVSVKHTIQVGERYSDLGGKGVSYNFSIAVEEAFRTYDFNMRNKPQQLTYEQTT